MPPAINRPAVAQMPYRNLVDPVTRRSGFDEALLVVTSGGNKVGGDGCFCTGGTLGGALAAKNHCPQVGHATLVLMCISSMASACLQFGQQ